MNAILAWTIVATILVGLAIDAHAAAWCQPLVDVAAWTLFVALMRVSNPEERWSYACCLVFATLGEVFLALVWGLYDYRLGNLPLFVPPGHVLLYALGRWCSTRLPFDPNAVTCIAAVLAAAGLAWTGIDRLSAPLTVLFLLCMRYGPAPRLYATMFVLALAMELVGTALGNWRWSAEVPWFGWRTINPPFAAGAFYCVLDLLVGLTLARRGARTAAAASMR